MDQIANLLALGKTNLKDTAVVDNAYAKSHNTMGFCINYQTYEV